MINNFTQKIMIKVISSSNNKIVLNGSKEIKLLKAVGLNGFDFLKSNVSFVISSSSCDSYLDITSPFDFLDIIDNPLMQRNGAIADFGNDPVIIKNKDLKTEIEFIIPDNNKFELFYEIDSYSKRLYPFNLNRELKKINCIKNNEENKGLTWHVNLFSIHESRDKLNELNNMYLFSGDNREALKFYDLLVSNNYIGEFQTDGVNTFDYYKYVYVYSSRTS